MMVQLLAVIGGGVPALIVMSVDDDDFLILGVAGNDVAGSANFSIASLRGRWRVIDHHIVYESGIQIVKYAKIT